MKTPAWGVGVSLLLASNLLAGQEAGEPTRATKAGELAESLERMRDDYQELLAECWGKGYYLQEPDGEVWQLSEAPDPKSCNKAESLKADYRAAYKELLKLDRRRVLFENVPKYIDRR